MKTKKMAKKDYTYAVGRRKESTARIRVYTSSPSLEMWGKTPIEKGKLYVNELPVASYFNGLTHEKHYLRPLAVTETIGKFTITARVVGGGKQGQLDAFTHGLARALVALDSGKYHKTLRDSGFLTRDARVRQRRNVGTGGKARRAKQSPKR